MAFSRKEINEIRKLRSEGLSASKVASAIHRRKKDVLSEIRIIENRPKSQRATHLFKEPIDKANTDAFIDALYRQGYSQDFIKKLVHEKHKSASKRYIDRRIHKEPKDAKAERKAYQDEIRKKGRRFAKDRINGKYYRETEHYYNQRIDWSRYPEEDAYLEEV